MVWLLRLKRNPLAPLRAPITEFRTQVRFALRRFHGPGGTRVRTVGVAGVAAASDGAEIGERLRGEAAPVLDARIQAKEIRLVDIRLCHCVQRSQEVAAEEADVANDQFGADPPIGIPIEADLRPIIEQSQQALVVRWHILTGDGSSPFEVPSRAEALVATPVCDAQNSGL